MSRRSASLVITIGLLAVPASAQAAGPAPPAPTLKLRIERAQPGSVLVRDRFVVRMVVRPYVPGQQVVVRIYRGPRRLAILPAVPTSAGAGAGIARVAFATGRPGRLTIRASHAATPAQPTFRARPLRLMVRPYEAAPGARGRIVRDLQRRLARLGYVVGQPGVYDDRTARAVIAFRKLVGMNRTAIASQEVFARLARGQGAFRVRFPDHGRHVEAKLSKQVLALIQGDRVVRIYPMSSGKPSTPTVTGSFRVYLKTAGTNAKGMVDSNYFIRGYAIHGYAEVPVFNASHGCLRVPIPEARSIFDWLRIGDRVDVYD